MPRLRDWSKARLRSVRLSWERAKKLADALPAEDPNRSAMRIAPGTMLCGTAWRVHVTATGDHFEELRELCSAAGDKASQAIGMAGLVMDRAHQDRMAEVSPLAGEAMALAESVGDPNLTVGLSFPLIFGKLESAEWVDVLRWSQTVVDLADGDPAKGNFLVGSPLGLATTTLGMAGYWLGRPGWSKDLRRGLPMARGTDPASYAGAVWYVYLLGIPLCVLRPDDAALQEIEEALRIAERSSDDVVVGFIRAAFGLAVMHRDEAAERDCGQQLGTEVREVLLKQRRNLCDVPIVEIYLTRGKAQGWRPR